MKGDKFWLWLANHVPRKLAYWCAIRVAAHATSGQWSDQEVPALTLDNLLKRWEVPRKASVPKIYVETYEDIG
jgi:hypothetical protein